MGYGISTADYADHAGNTGKDGVSGFRVHEDRNKVRTLTRTHLLAHTYSYTLTRTHLLGYAYAKDQETGAML